MNQNQRAIFAAILCHFFWGVSFLASRTALNNAPVTILLSHRFLLAFLVMSLLLPLPPALRSAVHPPRFPLPCAVSASTCPFAKPSATA